MLTPYGAVALGGALGAICRYVTKTGAQTFWGIYFPYGTLIVNSLGSFIGGLLHAVLSDRWSGTEGARLFIFSGFLGAYTTFSSFAMESLLMFEKHQWFKLCMNVLANNVGALFMVYLGWQLGKYIR